MIISRGLMESSVTAIGLIVTIAKREGAQDRRKPAVLRTNLIYFG
jgi:hypothetical protein